MLYGSESPSQRRQPGVEQCREFLSNALIADITYLFVAMTYEMIGMLEEMG
jgi:hypothetical protein